MKNKKIALTLIIALLFNCVAFSTASASTRIKDIVNFEGVRDNILIGYGLVVGLNGTGDKLNNTSFTEKSLIAYLERLGVNTRGEQLKTKNVAAVSVTATLPPFARQGSRIDITVSAMGDSKSLQGGVLLATPLMGADGEVYAAAQGSIAIGGFTASGDSGGSVTKATPTTGTISNGAIIEREIDFSFNNMETLDLSLMNPDVSTAREIEQVINERLQGQYALALDPGTVKLKVPTNYQSRVAMLIGDIEHLTVSPDQSARIVIDESSGTIVMGENVSIDTVAIAQGNLIVRIDEASQISQPGAFAPDGAQTAAVPRSSIQVSESEGNRMVVMEKGANLKDLVSGLNALGVGPRDLITILQTIKAAGALQAAIEVR
ncbi:MAG: flagellar biosynthesis protein FlgA [Alphaproteobacteria bacterium CG11_big_fil_rev_8_21_14_0_20_44_7]|nr:MAG: flagellar biosynthesis protein FlgA [Alphaproteobacteria bacterium CG11_big_fil_rev_8_21_14_0_20_44_7]